MATPKRWRSGQAGAGLMAPVPVVFRELQLLEKRPDRCLRGRLPIKTAKVEFACQIARFVMDPILGRRPVNAKPIKNERLRITLDIL
jgi:hypothetical protein